MIEVTYDIDETHIRRMLKALEELRLKKGTIITWSSEDIMVRGNKHIKIIPLWKWLLHIESNSF